MTTAAFVAGASLFGYLLPELVFLLSPHAEKFKRVPLLINYISVFAFGLMAYGVA